ncbi:MAG TPA: RNA polymerase sigma factor [Candidatus Dormibacteraeota bacterium]|jgi:RNA polymerase sigma-70 factor (ECF subfamily)|nr:RNA polymerase sigma factor [Candidatus Dormibacteraeota bacterium]
MVTSEHVEPSSDQRQLDNARDFEAAYRDVSRSAYLLARQIGRRPDEARDIVQEAALRAWRYRTSRTGDFRPWFLTIVYRLCRRPILDWVPLPAGWDRPITGGVDSAMDPDLVRALQSLPTRQRAAVWLRYCEDLAISDVARIMRVRESAAKQLLFRGREALRRRLQITPTEEYR